MNRQTPIHAHRVLDIIKQHTGPVLDAELRTEVTAAFGDDAVFINCQDRLFSLEQLIEFLASKDKVTVTGGRISLNTERLCEA